MQEREFVDTSCFLLEKSRLAEDEERDSHWLWSTCRSVVLDRRCLSLIDRFCSSLLWRNSSGDPFGPIRRRRDLWEQRIRLMDLQRWYLEHAGLFSVHRRWCSEGVVRVLVVDTEEEWALDWFVVVSCPDRRNKDKQWWIQSVQNICLCRRWDILRREDRSTNWNRLCRSSRPHRCKRRERFPILNTIRWILDDRAGFHRHDWFDSSSFSLDNCKSVRRREETLSHSSTRTETNRDWSASSMESTLSTFEKHHRPRRSE